MTTETRVLAVDGDPEGHAAVLEAADLLRAGELVALPTETVYGLAGDAANQAAVEKIFTVKNRPSDNPLIVHLADVTQLEAFARVNAQALALAGAFWPGPLTLVLPARPGLAQAVTRGLHTIAVRIPDHPVARAVIRAAGLGLAAPSANLSGGPSPTIAAHVIADLDGRIPLVLDGGPCRLGIESTVLDLSGKTPAILRPGMITAAEIDAILGVAPLQENTEALHRSPGTRYTHYSPKAKIILLAPEVSTEGRAALITLLLARESARVGYMGRHSLPRDLSTHTRFRHLRIMPRDLAHDLYQHLRAADNLKLTAMVIDGVVPSGQGVAMMDRLKKAATVFFCDDLVLEKWLAQAP